MGGRNNILIKWQKIWKKRWKNVSYVQLQSIFNLMETDFPISWIVTLWAWTHPPCFHYICAGENFLGEVYQFLTAWQVYYIFRMTRKGNENFSFIVFFSYRDKHTFAGHWIDPSFHPSKLRSHSITAFLHYVATRPFLHHLLASEDVTNEGSSLNPWPCNRSYTYKITFYFLMSCK